MNLHNVNTKRSLEDLEQLILAPYATQSKHSKGRLHQELMQDTFKTMFMEDRDRILNSEAFRRLKHKTQVFLTPSNDLYRTRLTHTLEVSVVARSLARIHKLNEDLVEAIALGHDLGHPPFGHAGEDILNTLAPHGFRHTAQSVRVVDFLENNGKGLNLSHEVRDGIATHSKAMGSILLHNGQNKSYTLEGQLVRFADRISYLIHDVDDAIRSEILSPGDIPDSVCHVLGNTQEQRLNTMITHVHLDLASFSITMTPEIAKASDELKNFLLEHVYKHPQVIDQANKAKELIERLFRFFEASPQHVLEKTQHISYQQESLTQRIVDYIAMMTDSFALRLYDKYVSLKKWFTVSQLE